MDRSRYKRPGAQSNRHTNNKNFGNSLLVTEVVAAHSLLNGGTKPQTATLRPEAPVPTASTPSLRPQNLQPMPRRNVVTPITPRPRPINNEFVSLPPKPVVAEQPKSKISRSIPVQTDTVRTPIASVMPQLASLETSVPEAVQSAPQAATTPGEWLNALQDTTAESYVEDYDSPTMLDRLSAKAAATNAKLRALTARAPHEDNYQEYETEVEEQAEPEIVAPVEQYVAPVVAAEPVNKATAQSPVEQPKVLTGLGPLDMELPGEESKTLFERMRSRKVRRWALRGIAISMVLVITTGGLLVSQSYLKANKVFRGTAGTAAALKKEVTPDLLDGEGSGRVNVLLLGRGGGTHDAPDLTDTLMIASIDPVNKKTTLLSIPRDLWVTVPGQGVSKLNAAFEKGVYAAQGSTKTNSTDPEAIKAGFKLVDQTISEATGLTINYNAVVNFDAFKQAVDTVNGVTVNVPSDLVDPTMAWENSNDPVLAHAGTQTMTGAKALQYTRSRETSSDFARSERQRNVMLALKDKIVSLGTLSDPTKISGLISAFGNNVTTDLSIKNAARLYEISKGISDANTASIDLASGENALVTTGNVNGQSVVLPKAGLFKYDAIKTYLRTQLQDPYILKEQARVMVLNGSITPGLATSMSDNLKAYGYNVTGAANTPTGNYTQTTVIDLSKGKDKFTKHYLEQRFGVTAKTKMPDDTIATNNADFVIIIGSDQATLPQTTTR